MNGHNSSAMMTAPQRFITITTNITITIITIAGTIIQYTCTQSVQTYIFYNFISV